MPTRNSGGSFSLNNPDDGTPIKEMFTLGDGLLFITEKCTYRMQVADQIDPDRTNPALPHNVQITTNSPSVSFEMIVVHLCSKHVQPFAGCPIVVAALPENYQEAWHVRFGYGKYYQDGQFAPIG